jgi:hypothetical protein
MIMAMTRTMMTMPTTTKRSKERVVVGVVVGVVVVGVVGVVGVKIIGSNHIALPNAPIVDRS